MDAGQVFAKAIEEFNAGNIRESETLCRTLLDAAPRLFQPLILAGGISFQTGHPEEAVDLLIRAASVQQLEAWHHILLARVLASLRRIDEAANQYLKALAMDPSATATAPDLEAVLSARPRYQGPKPNFPSPPWKASFVVDAPFQENRIFTPMPDTYLSHWPTSCWYALREAMGLCGVEIATQDIIPPESADIVLYMNVPSTRPLPEGEAINRSFLFAYEPAVVLSKNRDTNIHQHFCRVFIPDDTLTDGEKFIKMTVGSVDFPNERPVFVGSDKSKFCTMVNSAKYWPYYDELYSQRIAIVRWFEQNHPDEFDLYGAGWRHEDFPSYRRALNNKEKVTILNDYKFIVTYENNSGTPGCITEKIFDTMLGGGVPIYWGVPNITDYIPDECFIDRRNFRTHEDLYTFLKGISEEDYQVYLDNIADFLVSGRHGYFSDASFVSTVLRQLLPALK